MATRAEAIDDIIAADDARAPAAAATPAWGLLGSKAVLVVGDALTIALAGLLTVGLRRWSGSWSLSAASEVAVVLLTTPVWLLCSAQHRLYVARYVTRPLEETRRIVSAAVWSLVLVSAVIFFTEADVPRGLIGLHTALGVVLLHGERFIVRGAYDRARARGRLLRPVVIVGANDEGRALAGMLSAQPRLGYDVRAFVDDDAPGTRVDGFPVLGTIASTEDVVASTGSIGVIVAATAIDLGSSNRLIRDLTDRGIHVELSSTLRDIASHRLTVRPLGRFPVVYVEPVQRQGWRTVAKRAFDVVVAGVVLVVTAPVLAVAAMAIKATSRGPVLFRQERVGRNGEPFTVLKLRTMVDDAEDRLPALLDQNEADGPLFKMRADPRVTAVGAPLRRMSIDELPQLWNVLRGEMSLVGPRPALPREVPEWTDALHGRLRVRPGLTGMWQVSGRSDASFEDYARLDLYYVDNWSLVSDLAILVRTVPALLSRHGAA